MNSSYTFATVRLHLSRSRIVAATCKCDGVIIACIVWEVMSRAYGYWILHACSALCMMPTRAQMYF